MEGIIPLPEFMCLRFHSTALTLNSYKLRLLDQQPPVNFNFNHSLKNSHALRDRQQQERRLVFEVPSVGYIRSHTQALQLKQIVKSPETKPELRPLKQAIRIGRFVGVALAMSLITTCSPLSRSSSRAYAADLAKWATGYHISDPFGEMESSSLERIQPCGLCDSYSDRERECDLQHCGCCEPNVSIRSFRDPRERLRSWVVGVQIYLLLIDILYHIYRITPSDEELLQKKK